MVFLGNAITDAWKQSLMENTNQDMVNTYKSKQRGGGELNPIINALPQAQGAYQAYGQATAAGINALTDQLPPDQQNLALLLANLAEIEAARSQGSTVKLPLFSQSF